METVLVRLLRTLERLIHNLNALVAISKGICRQQNAALTIPPVLNSRECRLTQVKLYIMVIKWLFCLLLLLIIIFIL